MKSTDKPSKTTNIEGTEVRLVAYHHVIEMANSQSLRDRIMGCAAICNHSDPRGFVERNVMKIVAAAGWVTKWETAKNRDDPKFNPDTGARTDVIDDAMILAVCEPLVAAEQPQG
jgi:hypothetical protein